MKRLILVRHAKSSWKFVEARDHDRPLKERGVLKAYLVSENYANKIDNIDSIYSSSANRTLHTATIFAHSLGVESEKIIVSRKLYEMNLDDFFRFMNSVDDNNKTIILVIHNPLITTLAHNLGGMDIDNIPAAGLLDIEFDVDSWSEIKNVGKVINFITPKTLT